MIVETYEVEKMKRIIRQATIQLMDHGGTNRKRPAKSSRKIIQSFTPP